MQVFEEESSSASHPSVEREQMENSAYHDVDKCRPEFRLIMALLMRGLLIDVKACFGYFVSPMQVDIVRTYSTRHYSSLNCWTTVKQTSNTCKDT